MVKRILLASLFVFIPLFAHCETVVIGSQESLNERNLPFDFGAMSEAYQVLPEAIRPDFAVAFYDSLNTPFSVMDLFHVCTDAMSGFAPYMQIETCRTLTEEYIKEIVKISEQREAKQAQAMECVQGKFKSSNKFAKVQTKTLEEAVSLIKDEVYCPNADMSAIKCGGDCHVGGQDYVTCTLGDLSATFEFNDICNGDYKQKGKKLLSIYQNADSTTYSDYKDMAEFVR